MYRFLVNCAMNFINEDTESATITMNNSISFILTDKIDDINEDINIIYISNMSLFSIGSIFLLIGFSNMDNTKISNGITINGSMDLFISLNNDTNIRNNDDTNDIRE